MLPCFQFLGLKLRGIFRLDVHDGWTAGIVSVRWKLDVVHGVSKVRGEIVPLALDRLVDGRLDRLVFTDAAQRYSSHVIRREAQQTRARFFPDLHGCVGLAPVFDVLPRANAVQELNRVGRQCVHSNVGRILRSLKGCLWRAKLNQANITSTFTSHQHVGCQCSSDHAATADEHVMVPAVGS